VYCTPIYRWFISLEYRPPYAGGAAAAAPTLRGLSMAAQADEHERPMAFAQVAPGQIKALR
jgi:hypothetical protein